MSTEEDENDISQNPEEAYRQGRYDVLMDLKDLIDVVNGSSRETFHLVVGDKESPSLLTYLLRADLKHLNVAELRSSLGYGPYRFPITVDYRMTVEEMVRAGNYDSVWPENLTSLLTISGEGVVETEIEFFQLVSVNELDLSQLQEILTAIGLRLAKSEELLALCAQYPQENFFRNRDLWHITAFGSPVITPSNKTHPYSVLTFRREKKLRSLRYGDESGYHSRYDRIPCIRVSKRQNWIGSK